MDLEVIDLNEENPEVTTCPRKSVVSGLPKEFENSGNDSGLSVLKWLENIINEYNNENIKLYEKELIRDKNQMSIKSVRDLEDGFVIGLAVRVSPQDYQYTCVALIAVFRVNVIKIRISYSNNVGSKNRY